MRSHDEDRICLQLARDLTMLQAAGVVQKFAHINNEVFTKSWNQKRRIADMGSPAGLPDYIIVIRGQLLFLEVKTEKGRLSPHQKEWLDALTLATGKQAHVAYGYDEAIGIIHQLSGSKQ